MTLALSGKSSRRKTALILGSLFALALGTALSFGEWQSAQAGTTRTVRVQKVTSTSTNPGGTFTVTVGSLTFTPALNANETVGTSTATQNLAKNVAAAISEAVLPSGWAVDGYFVGGRPGQPSPGLYRSRELFGHCFHSE
jgi:hypothetical protein